MVGHTTDARPELVSFLGARSELVSFLGQNLPMGHNFNHKTSGLVTISVILPENGWFSCKLNKTYSNLVNFPSCLIAHSLGMDLFLFTDWSALVRR